MPVAAHAAPLPHFAADAYIVAIHPDSLDDPAGFHPTLVTYPSRALVWDRHDPALTATETRPGT